jgi:hypothetical protein
MGTEHLLWLKEIYTQIQTLPTAKKAKVALAIIPL